MPSPKAARTTRRLLKIASLGIAGLIVGLLSGCSSSSPNSVSLATYTQPNSLSFNSNGFTPNYLPGSLYSHPTPSLRHPPAPHRIESWADRTPHQVSSPFSSQIDDAPTLTNYAFIGTGHLTVQ
jgi:hypothetical protein